MFHYWPYCSSVYSSFWHTASVSLQWLDTLISIYSISIISAIYLLLTTFFLIRLIQYRFSFWYHHVLIIRQLNMCKPTSISVDWFYILSSFSLFIISSVITLKICELFDFHLSNAIFMTITHVHAGLWYCLNFSLIYLVLKTECIQNVFGLGDQT